MEICTCKFHIYLKCLNSPWWHTQHIGHLLWIGGEDPYTPWLDHDNVLGQPNGLASHGPECGLQKERPKNNKLAPKRT